MTDRLYYITHTIKKVVVDQGNGLGSHENMSLDECEDFCNKTTHCHSFAYCSSGNNGCYLKDKILDGSEPTHASGGCTTYYHKCHGGNHNETISLHHFYNLYHYKLSSIF